MNRKIANAIDALEQTGCSAALAVADHLSTVAKNGPEYATTEAMHVEARAVIQAAQSFLNLTKGQQPPVFLLIEDEPSNSEFPSIVCSVHDSQDGALIAKEERQKKSAEKIAAGIAVDWHIEETEVQP